MYQFDIIISMKIKLIIIVLVILSLYFLIKHFIQKPIYHVFTTPQTICIPTVSKECPGLKLDRLSTSDDFLP